MSTARPIASAGTVPALLDAAAATVPTRRAVADEYGTLDYRTLATRVEATAAALRGVGIGRGDRVAIVLPNSIAFVDAFLGVLAAGAAAMPLPAGARSAELRRLFAETPVAAAITAVDDDRALAPIQLAAGPDGIAVDRAPAARSTRAVAGPAPDDPALVAFSSGTTARPHLVTRSHANLWWEAENFAAAIPLGHDDVVLGVVPLSHAHGLGNALLASLRAGASLLLRPRFLRRQVLDLLAVERVALFPAVPFMLRMLAATDRRRRFDVSALRWCVSAGAPLPDEVFTAFHERFGVRVRQLYGLTEAGSVTCDVSAAVEPGSVGTPLGTVVVTVEDENGRALPPGTPGEIVVRSPAVEGGRDRALRTRDLGRLDAGGRLTITGRTSLFINTAGNKVDPAEVEAALRTHPDVADVAVFGLAAAHDEQVVAAAVVLAPSATITADGLRAHCRELLAPHKVPRVLSFRAALPRSPLGKVLIGRLVAEA